MPSPGRARHESGMTPAEARVVSWPGGPLAPLNEVLVYEAATLAPLTTAAVPEGLIGAGA